ncbi:hypothetical protein CP532_3376 [Ophiocordyceps camponoti-leonardi (nom. inval.)]|nr:hypothetical protein CP532_3376 [Ophiocordyceps camponoti-leonardi (nom. inval.)]
MRWAQIVSVLPLWLSWSASSNCLIVREKAGDGFVPQLFSRQSTEAGPAVKPKKTKPAVQGPHPSAPNPGLALMGYRTVSDAQAEHYYTANTLTPDPNLAQMQLGRGVYTTPRLQGWEDAGWQCAIFADKEKLSKVPKIIVSRSLYQETEDHDPTMNIHAHIKQRWPHVDPRRCLLLGYIDYGPTMQMLIPFDLLDANEGGLNISVECASSNNAEALREKVDVILDHDVAVNYTSWEGVLGELSDYENDYSDYGESSSSSNSRKDAAIDLTTKFLLPDICINEAFGNNSRAAFSFMKLKNETANGNETELIDYVCPNPPEGRDTPTECVDREFGGDSRRAFMTAYYALPAETTREREAAANCTIDTMPSEGIRQRVFETILMGQTRNVHVLEEDFPFLQPALLALLSFGLCLPHDQRLQRRDAAQHEDEDEWAQTDIDRLCCRLEKQLREYIAAVNPELARPDYHEVSRIRPLGQVVSVRINNIDNESPGELYGRITVDDQAGYLDIYNVERRFAQFMHPGGMVALTDARVIEASAPFTISVELWDKDNMSSDDLISKGEINWAMLGYNYNKVFSADVSAAYGSATVKWLVIRHAIVATIKVTLINGDDEYPVNVYGTCTFKTRYVERKWFDVDPIDNFDVYPGSVIHGTEVQVPVSYDDVLGIHLDLWDSDSLSPDDNISGGVTFLVPNPGTTDKRRIMGRKGEAEVEVKWS